MMKRLEDKVAIVTGAAQGLGETYAKALAAEGAKVMVSDIDDPTRVVDEINGSNGVAAGIVCDVTDDIYIGSMVATTEKKFGSVEILVNNAALFAAISFGSLNLPSTLTVSESKVPSVTTSISTTRPIPDTDLIQASRV